MQPLTAPELRGVWSSVLLPVRADESIDMGRLAEVVDFLVGAGVHGIYTNGTAGEFYTPSDAEYDTIHEMVAAKCTAAGVAYQFGASHPSGQLSLDGSPGRRTACGVRGRAHAGIRPAAGRLRCVLQRCRDEPRRRGRLVPPDGQ